MERVLVLVPRGLDGFEAVVMDGPKKAVDTSVIMPRQRSVAERTTSRLYNMRCALMFAIPSVKGCEA